MSFSDDDFKRLKQHIGYFTVRKDQAYLPWPPNLDLEAFLARVEAAEQYKLHHPCRENHRPCLRDEAWRKAAGK